MPKNGTEFENLALSLPENKIVNFSDSPEIVFDIKYKTIIVDLVQMDIYLRNNLSESITLFNLWIRVNKSTPNENILIKYTKFIETNGNLSLSTFTIKTI